MEGNVPLTFLDDVDQFIKEYLGIGKITGEVVATDLVAIIKSIGDVGMQCLQTGIIIGRQPEHHAPVCGVRVLKLWAVKDTGRYQADITVFQGIDILADLIGEIAAQKKVNLIIIVTVHGHISHVLVLIIKDLKICGLHLLPFIKL